MRERNSVMTQDVEKAFEILRGILLKEDSVSVDFSDFLGKIFKRITGVNPFSACTLSKDGYRKNEAEYLAYHVLLSAPGELTKYL